MQNFTAFERVLSQRFGGVIYGGTHEANGQACLLEVAHAACEDVWSDKPDKWPDLRYLNDGPWSSGAARTAALVPGLRAYWEWSEWGTDRQQQVIHRVVILTVQRIVAELPGLPGKISEACRAAETLEAARATSEAASESAWEASGATWESARAASVAAWAASESAGEAAWAAREAARAANGAARAAGADRDHVLEIACTLWIEAANEVQP